MCVFHRYCPSSPHATESLLRRSHNRSIAHKRDHALSLNKRQGAKSRGTGHPSLLVRPRGGGRGGDGVTTSVTNCDSAVSPSALRPATAGRRVRVWRFVKLCPATQMPSKDHRRDFRQPRDRQVRFRLRSASNCGPKRVFRHSRIGRINERSEIRSRFFSISVFKSDAFHIS